MNVDAATIGTARLVGGHRALDLVNTVAPRLPEDQQSDYLATPADLILWSQRTGLLDAATAREVELAWDAAPGAARRALGAVREIREALYEVLSAYLRDGETSMATGQLSHISLSWASVLPRARLLPHATGPGVARWVVTSPPALLVADLATQDAVDLLCGMDATRLKRCPVAEGGCGWLFLDHSRNRSRRWCAMEDCGTEVKSHRLTDRRRSSRGAA